MIENTVILKVEDYKNMVLDIERKKREIEELNSENSNLCEHIEELLEALAKEIFSYYYVSNSCDYISQGRIKSAQEYLDNNSYLKDKIPEAFVYDIELIFEREVDKKLKARKEAKE